MTVDRGQKWSKTRDELTFDWTERHSRGTLPPNIFLLLVKLLRRKSEIDTRRVESYWRHLAWAENSELAGTEAERSAQSRGKYFVPTPVSANDQSHQTTTTYSDLGAG